MITNLKKTFLWGFTFAFLSFSSLSFSQKKYSKKQIEKLKTEVEQIVEANKKQSQVMVDKIFSFSELGFQEYESTKYLTGILKDNGFEIENGISGITTAWLPLGVMETAQQ